MVPANKKTSPKLEQSDSKKLKTSVPQQPPEQDSGKTSKKQGNYLPSSGNDTRLEWTNNRNSNL